MFFRLVDLLEYIPYLGFREGQIFYLLCNHSLSNIMSHTYMKNDFNIQNILYKNFGLNWLNLEPKQCFTLTGIVQDFLEGSSNNIELY